VATFSYSSSVGVGAQQACAWHGRPGGFERLVPPWENLRVAARTGGVEDGSRWDLKLSRWPLTLTWVAEHRDCHELGFKDVQLAGPFSRWEHTHRFVPDGDGCTLDDSIEYDLPLGGLGALVAGGYVQRNLQRTFRWRHTRVAHDLLRHAAVDAEPADVVISGASGLIGQALTAFLTAGGHRVRRLVRRQPGEDEIAWDPARGEIDAAALEGAHIVIHLAGAPVAGGRWTDARKRLIMDSRVDGTTVLSTALAGLTNKPHTLISASAIGFYGDCGDEPVDETAPQGGGFLADVCGRWEQASQPARDAGIRVANARIGVALSQRSGALAEMLPPFRMGVGAVAGDGRPWLSWVALDDVLGALHHAAFTPALVGPFNIVSPNAQTHEGFAKTLGRVLRRPVFVPLPKAAVRLIFGELGQETLLQGARVQPAALQRTGFEFRFPDLEETLRVELGRVR